VCTQVVRRHEILVFTTACQTSLAPATVDLTTCAACARCAHMDRWSQVRDAISGSPDLPAAAASAAASAAAAGNSALPPVAQGSVAAEVDHRKAAVRRRQIELKERDNNGIDIESREFKQGQSARAGLAAARPCVRALSTDGMRCAV